MCPLVNGARPPSKRRLAEATHRDHTLVKGTPMKKFLSTLMILPLVALGPVLPSAGGARPDSCHWIPWFPGCPR